MNALKQLNSKKHNYIAELLHSKKFNRDIELLNYFQMIAPDWDEKTYFSLFKLNPTCRWSINNSDLRLLDCEGEENFYCSVNSFYAPGKQTGKYAKSLNTLVIDLDYYNMPYLVGLEPWQVIKLLEEDVNYPTPSFYVNSGRGLYLIWLLEKTHATTKSKKYWQQIEETLIEQFKDFGADPKVKDIARVTRLTGTKNSKNGNTVRLIYPDCIEELETYHLNPIRYELSDIAEYYWGYKSKVNPEPLDKSKKAKKRTCKVTALKTILSLHYSRYRDLETLVELRQDKHMEGIREKLLFIYRLQLLFANVESSKALEKVLELNNKMLDPLSEAEVVNATYNAEDNAEIYFRLKSKYKEDMPYTLNEYLSNGGVYLYKNSTIIRELKITQSEMESMITLINPEEKKRRKNIKNKDLYVENKEYHQKRFKKYYKDKLKGKGRMSKKEQLEDIYTKIKSLKNEGFKNKDIAQELDLPIKTLERHITYMKKNGLL